MIKRNSVHKILSVSGILKLIFIIHIKLLLFLFWNYVMLSDFAHLWHSFTLSYTGWRMSNPGRKYSEIQPFRNCDVEQVMFINIKVWYEVITIQREKKEGNWIESCRLLIQVWFSTAGESFLLLFFFRLHMEKPERFKVMSTVGSNVFRSLRFRTTADVW